MRPNWLTRAITLEGEDKTEAALDLVYNHIDDDLIAQRFEEVEHLLCYDDNHLLETNLILGIITVTRPYRLNLLARPTFCAAVRATLIERGYDPDTLLTPHDISP